MFVIKSNYWIIWTTTIIVCRCMRIIQSIFMMCNMHYCVDKYFCYLSYFRIISALIA